MTNKEAAIVVAIMMDSTLLGWGTRAAHLLFRFLPTIDPQEVLDSVGDKLNSLSRAFILAEIERLRKKPHRWYSILNNVCVYCGRSRRPKNGLCSRPVRKSK